MKTRNCLHCGAEFEVPPEGRPGAGYLKKHCSPRCRRAHCEERARGACAECGQELSAGSAWNLGEAGLRPLGQRKCADCYHREQRAGAEPNRQRIVAMWAEGRSLRGICEALGWTKGRLSGEMHRMRALGYRLPYRYKPRGRPDYAHPGQAPPP